MRPLPRAEPLALGGAGRPRPRVGGRGGRGGGAGTSAWPPWTGLEEAAEKQKKVVSTYFNTDVISNYDLSLDMYVIPPPNVPPKFCP